MKPRRLAQVTDGTAARWVASTCGLCSLGCGLEIGVDGDRIVGVRGRVDHPVGLGRLGPKGLAQWRANAHPSRGLYPRIADARATWDDALSVIGARISEAVARRGPSTVGFYNSGQLLLEEYYTLGKLARAGIATPCIDANTRLCTATAAESLMESFGADGPPGAFIDFEETECIVLFGHNAAEQSTVLWMRIMAARDGRRRPKVIAIDPRRTLTVETGVDLHLAPRPGTNVAVVNGLCHLLIENGDVDREFIARHTVGYELFAQIVGDYHPGLVEDITGIPAAKLREAARWIGESASTITTVLQGVYQSHQASATACGVNSMHLLMGKIGKPGSAPMQFAGQPSSMNTRECGADGTYPGYRNWANPAHMADLAARWNVPVELLGKKPVSAPEIFELCEHGHIEVLVVTGTNPAASLEDTNRTLRTLGNVFLVVADPFADTETAQLADVYLPTAMWGEKTGCMTNAERRCNLVQAAVAPPGEARPDLDIFIELAHRLRLTDKDGEPLIKYRDARGAFAEWKRISKGTICDYSGMSYERILERGGIQWPCNDANPDGTVRLYSKPEFPTATSVTEAYFRDLETGHLFARREYDASQPRGRARLLAVHYEPSLDPLDGEHDRTAITGRLAVHWHTRTKTGKAPELDAVAPAMFVELNTADAARLGIGNGELVRVTSRRGEVVAPAKIGDVVPEGVVFLPFHYGDANLLTPPLWDPASKQPVQKLAAVRIEKAGAR